MFKRLFLLLILMAVAFGAYISNLPPAFRVERTALINATPSAIFDHINDLKKWNAWSPWAKKDPNTKMTYEGPSAGKDAAFAWVGNDQVGEGRMTITESKPTDAIRMRLDFVKPFAGTSQSGFDIKPEGGKTRVTWFLSGEQSFVERAICTLMRMNMDKMVGTDYEQGLENLKAIVEGRV